MRKTKKKKFLVRRIVLVIIIIVLIFIGRHIIVNINFKQEQKELRLLYNNEFVKLQNALYVEDDVVYISEDDVRNTFDSTIDYNSTNKELITTYNKHIAVLHLASKEMLVNDSDIQMQGTLKQIGEKIYLPLTDLQIVYDIEEEYFKDTNIIAVDTTTKAKNKALVIRKSGVKQDNGFFAVSISEVKVGEYVYIVEDLGDSKKIRTKNGIIGYVGNRTIADIENVRQEWKENELNESDFKNAFIINEKTTGIENMSEAFKTYSQRNDVIKEVYKQVVSGEHYPVINDFGDIDSQYSVIIDFKNIDNIDLFYRFLIELTPKFNESGINVALKMNTKLDEQKIKNMVNYIIK